MRRIVVIGGSIAASTAASTLLLEGFDGEVLMISAEASPPYSRVPLSKGVLTGQETPDSTRLPDLPSEVDLRLGVAASGLDIGSRQVILSTGEAIGYDGLICATGARARRAASPGQRGELCLRDLTDALAIMERVKTARSALILGGGFLGMELASTLIDNGLEVTVVSTAPPLQAQLGDWLSAYVRERAVARGVRMLVTGAPARLIGDPVAGIDAGPHGMQVADLVISAIGDVPNTEWLNGSGLPVANGLVADPSCAVINGIAVAGDVSATGQGGLGRSPHWTNAVVQGAAAARSVLGKGKTVSPDPYFWTEQHGLDVKISGGLRPTGSPQVLAGDMATDSALLQWRDAAGRATSVAINYRIPIIKLKRLGAQEPESSERG